MAFMEKVKVQLSKLAKGCVRLSKAVVPYVAKPNKEQRMEPTNHMT